MTLTPTATSPAQDGTTTVAPEPSATPAPTATSVPTPTSVPAPTPTPTFDVPAEPLFDLRGEVPLSTAQLNELILFVERQAGRTFKRPPNITAQASEAFRAGVEDVGFERWLDPELTARRLQALGQTEISAAVFASSLNEGFGAGVGGYYDAESDALYMPVDEYPIRLFTVVLVHELTHALDGQYVDLGGFEDRWNTALDTGNFEELNAIRAIVEGRAAVVEDAWSWPPHWSPAEDAEREIVSRPPVPFDIPQALIEEASVPYVRGPIFIRAHGGVAETWGFYDDVPASTEAILIPDALDQPIVEVDVPVADGPILETRVFGALDLGLVLRGRGSPTSLARGWAGGRSVMWGDDESTCIRMAVATDTDDDRERLFKTFERWVDLGDGNRTVVIDDDLIVATACAAFVP